MKRFAQALVPTTIDFSLRGWRRWSLLLGLSLFLASCGWWPGTGQSDRDASIEGIDSGDGDDTPDSSAAVDVGGAHDSGAASDVGGAHDSGAAIDAGGTHDSGAAIDAGGTHDSGVAGDAGAASDASSGDPDGGSIVCPSTRLPAGDSVRAISVGGTSREYILHVPSSYDGSKPVPLVVDFHPIMGSEQGECDASPYKAQTDPEGVITLYPNGAIGPIGRAWNVGPCCVANVDDVAFAKALVSEIEKVACINPKRVYAVGYSMGGGMSHYIACHAADVFAAVAPAAFDLLKENEDGCTPSRPISVISFRSKGDSMVWYDGGYSTFVQPMPITFLGAVATFQKWAEIDQCTGSPSVEDSNGCSTYTSCKDGVQVTLCSNPHGGHDYGNATVGWPLLKKYTLP